MGLTRILGGIVFFVRLHNPVQAVQSVTSAWDPSPDTKVVGYFRHFGSASGNYTNKVDVGNLTSATINGLVEGKTYFFAVTAYIATGLESIPSNEIGYTVPLSNNLPTIALTSPTNGASYTAPATINFVASVIANGHAITKVQFYNSATLLGEDTSGPYSLAWSSVSTGSYSLTARAVYDAGSTVASSPANVTVVTVNTAPTISNIGDQGTPVGTAVGAISFTVGDIETAAGSLTVTGSSGNPTLVPNGNIVFGGSGAGRTVTVTPAANQTGTATITVTVSDGASAASDTFVLTVNAVNPAPTVVLSAPLSGASYPAPATISLAANVTANGHSITKVQFYNGATLLGEDPSAPYSFIWNNGSQGSYSLTARAVENAGSTVDSSPVNINVTGLPAPWQTADIGSASVAGSASVSNGIYTVMGAGNISGTADNFRFVYQPLSGNGEIKVRLSSVANTGTSGRIGVIIRESLTSGSKYAFMGISPAGTFTWQRRSKTSGSTSSAASTTGTPPNVWMRLVRTGDTLDGYRSADGTIWTLVNSRSITMATTIYIGFGVASGSSNTLNTATFTDMTVVP